MILTGSSGTGKTLILLEVLKMKVAWLSNMKNDKENLRLIVGVYDDEASVLIKDLENKYGLGEILSDLGVEPKTIGQLAKGFYFSNYLMILYFVTYLTIQIMILSTVP